MLGIPRHPDVRLVWWDAHGDRHVSPGFVGPDGLWTVVAPAEAVTYQIHAYVNSPAEGHVAHLSTRRG